MFSNIRLAGCKRAKATNGIGRKAAVVAYSIAINNAHLLTYYMHRCRKIGRGPRIVPSEFSEETNSPLIAVIIFPAFQATTALRYERCRE